MQKLANFFGNVCKFCKKFDEKLLKFCEWSGAKEYQSDRSRHELSNEYLVAKIGFDTVENEHLKVWITDLSDHALDHIPPPPISDGGLDLDFLDSILSRQKK